MPAATALSALVRLYDAEVRRRLPTPAPGFRFERDGPVLRMIGPDAAPSSNGIVHSSLDAANADEVIKRQIAFFRGLGRAFEWKLFSYDEPNDMRERLLAAGFVPEEDETFVAFDLSDPRPSPVATPGITVRRIVDPGQFNLVADVNGAVYGDLELACRLVVSLRAEARATPDGLRLYAAFADGAPISVGWMRHRPGEAFGSLWGGATLQEWRGKGAYSALVAARVAEARDRGCRYLTVDCSPMSLPILDRRGFQRLATTTPHIWRP